MIQLHRLEGFFWVAKTGGYARAARAFPYPITQPAVHQQVRKLEDELGLELFERVAKDRVRPTPAGRALMQFVQPFFEGLPAALRAVRAGAGAGELVVYCEPLLLRLLLPRWIKRMQRRAPDTCIDLHELREIDVSLLRRGDADLLVCYLPEVPDDIATQVVATLRPFLVVSADHPRAANKRLRPKDLAGEPFVAYNRGTVEHDLQMGALAEFGVRPERLLFASSADAILGFVASGLGYSLVPHLSAEELQSSGVSARPLSRPKIEFPISAAWRRDAPENAALDLALETAPGR